MQTTLQQQFGNIDIYLFDQLLKGTYDNCRKVLDVGCGAGRNLVYFLQHGFDVYALTRTRRRVAGVKELSKQLSPKHKAGNFKVAAAEHLPFKDHQFDLVISSAVLHFAQDERHFDAMLLAMWRVVKSGGFFFARLASDIGIETLVHSLGNKRYFLPDGSERFLVNQQMLLDKTGKLNGYLHEPIKTTNVQNLRCMTTWCLQKL